MPKPLADEKLFVTTFGEGLDSQTILCLHGIEAYGMRLFGMAQRLNGVRIVAPDLRGHGRSPKQGPWTIEQHLDDLLPILESLGSDTIVLGHSYGGLVAWELARAAPDGLNALVLVDPALAVDEQVASWGIEYSLVNAGWVDEHAAIEHLLEIAAPSGRWAAALDVAVAMERDDDGMLRPIVSEEALLAGWEQMRQPIRPTSWRGPTLLLEAGRETGNYVSAALIQAMSSQLGSALEHKVLDATHFIPSDYPDQLAAEVDRFTTRLRGATRS